MPGHLQYTCDVCLFIDMSKMNALWYTSAALAICDVPAVLCLRPDHANHRHSYGRKIYTGEAYRKLEAWPVRYPIISFHGFSGICITVAFRSTSQGEIKPCDTSVILCGPGDLLGEVDTNLVWQLPVSNSQHSSITFTLTIYALCGNFFEGHLERVHLAHRSCEETNTNNLMCMHRSGLNLKVYPNMAERCFCWTVRYFRASMCVGHVNVRDTRCVIVRPRVSLDPYFLES